MIMGTSAKDIARELLPLTRKKDAHKYDFGHLLVIGGNQVYTGSPTFNSLAAYRTGVDLVTTVAPKRSADIIASFSPSLITYPLQGDYFSSWHLDQVFNLAGKCSAVVIGGGLGRKQETKEAVVRFLDSIELPCVIDADAIWAVAQSKKTLLKDNHLITPHQREFELLTAKAGTSNYDDVREQVKETSSELNCTILLKGRDDVISNGETTVINQTGTPHLTKGGTGDILAGIAGSLLGQGLNLREAAAVAAYLNGKAGELATKDKQEGLLAEDLLDQLPAVLKNLG